jgi:hypothetical protein
MKGFIYTELLDMVGEVFSPEMVEKIIDASDLPNKGGYTDVGTYNYEELIRLVTHLSKFTGMPVPDLEIAYGKYLFTKLYKRHSKLVMATKTTFEFLDHVDRHVHVEVLKLYPDAELPRFICEIQSPNAMTMHYQSNHPFQYLAEGLILGCAAHFKEKINITSEQLGAADNKITNVLFSLTRVD